MITATREDYLRAIYLLEKDNMEVKAIDVAKKLDLAKSTVSERLKELTMLGYVTHDDGKSIKFTKLGKLVAEQLTYKHRIIEVFLSRLLKMDEKMVHQEANRLEHAFSDNAIERLRILLNDPKHCPHGQSIEKPR